MVQVNGTHGRLGNKMFEYAFGRIIAEHFNFKYCYRPVNSAGLDDFNNLKMPRDINGEEYTSPVQTVDGTNTYSYSLLDEILADTRKRYISITGYFQKYIYFKNYKEKLKKWFYFDTKKHNYENAIGLHIRKGDQANTLYDLPDEYFIDILKSENYEKIYITSDENTHNTIKTIQSEFKNVEIFNSSAVGTLEHFVCFDKLICTCGTYSWWIGILSDAKKIYYPNKVINEIDLRVNDDPRFVLI